MARLRSPLRPHLPRSVVACAAALLAGAAVAQEDVEIRRVDVAPGVHMLLGRGGNIGVSSGADGVVLVDDQFAPLSAKIRAAVATLGSGDVRFVLNTHWHGDHTGGNENFGRAGALIVAHDGVRARMSVEQVLALRDRVVPASPPEALPVVTFAESVTLHLNGDAIEAIHAPAAHTDGDTFIMFRGANVIHAGDIYFNGNFPFIDLSSGGSLTGLIAAVDAILERADDRTRIIPGHGPLSNRSELAAYRGMLLSVRDRVAQALAEGRSADESVASSLLQDLEGRWGGGFIDAETMIRTAHQSLSGS
jgi:glyoxylase-like metal-dependent hydrolase (beta-lactamase superfamily II)